MVRKSLPYVTLTILFESTDLELQNENYLRLNPNPIGRSLDALALQVFSLLPLAGSTYSAEIL